MSRWDLAWIKTGFGNLLHKTVTEQCYLLTNLHCNPKNPKGVQSIRTTGHFFERKSSSRLYFLLVLELESRIWKFIEPRASSSKDFRVELEQKFYACAGLYSIHVCLQYNFYL